ncbi:hypothetical protein ACO0LB_00005, partial [Undibacterium sp. SXout7W]|uniref:hypothetical protein n=1 Tax=Undibacterium sp. SXout7W TaxID=3413049 RepID=UPI003BF0730D
MQGAGIIFLALHGREESEEESVKAKPPVTLVTGGSQNTSLTITYFHTGCSTIIGAESFHGPVR